MSDLSALRRRLAEWRPAHHAGDFSTMLIISGILTAFFPGLRLEPALSIGTWSINIPGLLIVLGAITFALHKGILWRWRRPYTEIPERYRWDEDDMREEHPRADAPVPAARAESSAPPPASLTSNDQGPNAIPPP